MTRKKNILAFGGDHVISFLDLSERPEQYKLTGPGENVDHVQCVGGTASPFVDIVYDINRNSNILFALGNDGTVNMFDTRAYFRKKQPVDIEHFDQEHGVDPYKVTKVKAPGADLTLGCRLLHTFPALPLDTVQSRDLTAGVAQVPAGMATVLPGQVPLPTNQMRFPLSNYKKADLHCSLGYLHIVTPNTWCTYATGNTRQEPVLVFRKDLSHLSSMSENVLEAHTPVVVHVRRDMSLLSAGNHVYIFSMPVNELWYSSFFKVLMSPIVMSCVLGVVVWKVVQDRSTKKKQRATYAQTREQVTVVKPTY